MYGRRGGACAMASPKLVQGSKQEDVKRGKPRQAQDQLITRSFGVPVTRLRIKRCGCVGSGAHMCRHEPRPPLASESTRPPVLGDIGFVGLGHMGTAMAANLVASGRRVIGYVRRPDQIGRLEALGLRATTDITDLLDCKVVISMLPDDDAVREIVFGRKDIGLEGLAAGMMAGAIHLSMSTISTAAASVLASEHARNGQGYVPAPVFGNPDAAKALQLFIIAAGAPADI